MELYLTYWQYKTKYNYWPEEKILFLHLLHQFSSLAGCYKMQCWCQTTKVSLIHFFFLRTQTIRTHRIIRFFLCILKCHFLWVGYNQGTETLSFQLKKKTYSSSAAGATPLSIINEAVFYINGISTTKWQWKHIQLLMIPKHFH